MELTKEYFDQVIQNLMTKVTLKEDLEVLRADMPTKEDYNRLQQSVDAFTKHYKDHDEEMTVLQHHDEATQKWIKVAAPKIGVEYSA